MEPTFELHTIKPKDLKKKDFEEHICLRCYKQPALPNSMFCERCLRERGEIDEFIKLRNKDKPKEELKPSWEIEVDKED